MRYIKLGSTGLDVSPIALGCMAYGEPDRGHPSWSLAEADSRPLIRQAVGRRYQLLRHREHVLAGIKRGNRRPGATGFRRSRFHRDRHETPASDAARSKRIRPVRKAIFTEIDHSLRRLGTEYVDIYQIHRMDNATPVEETLEALHEVVKAGKARYLGASSMHAWEFSMVLHLQRQHGWSRFVCIQDHYNLLAREEEREMLPLCAHEGIGTIPWSPLARGRLAREAPTRRSASDPFADMLYSEEASDHAIIDGVADVARDRGAISARLGIRPASS